MSPNYGQSNPDLKMLISEITRKAQGVFIWVRVVVTNMISAMEDGNTKEELESHLSRLPDDVRGLYDAIINQIPSKYLHDIINYFRIVLAGRNWRVFPTF